MSLHLPFSCIPILCFFVRPLAERLESLYRRLLYPPVSPVRGVLIDLTYTKAELIAENALLRHQLGILQRQVKRPILHRRDRFGLFLLASRVRS